MSTLDDAAFDAACEKVDQTRDACYGLTSQVFAIVDLLRDRLPLSDNLRGLLDQTRAAGEAWSAAVRELPEVSA